MKLNETPEKLNQMDERLDELQEARDEYHTIRTGFIHYNMPDQATNVEPYIGAEVSDEDFLEAGYKLVEKLVSADEVFETLKEVKNVLSKLEDDEEIRGKKVEKWRYEINEYALERQQLVENIFEISEPITESEEIDFDIGAEYTNRLESAGLSYV